ncbi:hypothetical protein BAG01nite_39030 [Brevibacillus agri]|uniref:YtzI protein n=1 Tax=Brevibacillus agri TaxID=51101 RepID=A0ABQ0SVL1_9BACL|nr:MULTISPECIES: hypothetical protein [Brevibacillus]ELK43869.1 hypothetical protein D478_01130 [Brevibacillus agri BAB-2500]EJL43922.1 hypothetical protein PMI08_02273 [Brevibacillus sp. CF112]MBY0053315.1 hypothetical protein [Brevibacillus agri]MCG5253426.1 hypothetical protein [Brevibacillus agri]MDN4095055.1 hypothetical protein [Brevibacillus agri]
MSTGFIIVLVLTFVLIIGATILVTNKAYSRKPEQIDPLPGKDAASKELDQ